MNDPRPVVGLIGLGNMGTAFAERLLDGGYELVVSNRTPGKTDALEARHRWEGDRIPTGLLRLSVGLEDPDALWADLEQALARA